MKWKKLIVMYAWVNEGTQTSTAIWSEEPEDDQDGKIQQYLV